MDPYSPNLWVSSWTYSPYIGPIEDKANANVAMVLHSHSDVFTGIDE